MTNPRLSFRIHSEPKYRRIVKEIVHGIRDGHHRGGNPPGGINYYGEEHGGGSRGAR
jgi:hypothetical protein